MGLKKLWEHLLSYRNHTHTIAVSLLNWKTLLYLTKYKYQNVH